jgi:hypothetical protein
MGVNLFKMSKGESDFHAELSEINSRYKTDCVNPKIFVCLTLSF